MPELDENLIKRIMPHDDETERSLLGTIMMDQEMLPIAIEYVTPEDFYNRQFGATFQAMIDLYDNRQPIDPVTLHNKLSEMDVPPEVTTFEFIGAIVNSVSTSVNAKSYAKYISEKATLRKLIRVNEEIANACYAGKGDMESILDETEKKIFNLIQKRNSNEFVPIKQVVMNSMNQIEKASRSKGAVTGVASGFTDLDAKTMGFHGSELILIAARPAMGKTALVLNIAENVAFKQDKCIAIFNLEMSRESLVNRLLAMNSKVDSQHIRNGQLNDQEWHKLIESAGIASRSKLILDDTPSLTVAELRSKCRKYKLEYDLQMVIIDYLQLMTGSGRSEGSRQQEISDISRGLKILARELDVPIIALSQLSRAVEQRNDHRPMLSDLRESGAIEQDADVVMFIYRDDYYNQDSEKKGISELIIAKQRNGPIGTVDLAWMPEFTKFANLKRENRNNG